MKKQARVLTLIPTILGIGVFGSWGLTNTANQGHDVGENVRLASSQTRPRMDGGHLEAKAVEVIYQPGGYTWRIAMAVRSATVH